MAATKRRFGVTSLLVGGAFAAALAVLGFWLARPSVPDLSGPALIAAGKMVYAGHCTECHGGNLEGEPNWRTPYPDGSLPAPPHDASGHTWHHADKVLFGIIRDGGASVAPKGFPSRMPAFGGQISEREIWAVLAFIKSTWPEEIQKRQEAVSRRAR